MGDFKSLLYNLAVTLLLHYRHAISIHSINEPVPSKVTHGEAYVCAALRLSDSLEPSFSLKYLVPGSLNHVFGLQ